MLGRLIVPELDGFPDPTGMIRIQRDQNDGIGAGIKRQPFGGARLAIAVSRRIAEAARARVL